MDMATDSSERNSPNATHERVLRVLGMTRRPLESGELQQALALVPAEAQGAFRWLTEHGYIMRTVRRGRAAAQSAMASWTLADKGRTWAKGQGALSTQAV